MTIIRTCSNLAQAELCKSVLAGSGVSAFLPDEDSVLWGNVLGGYRVQVDDADVDRANEVLRQANLPASPEGQVEGSV